MESGEDYCFSKCKMQGAVLSKLNRKQKNCQSTTSNGFVGISLLMRSVCILDSDTVNDRKVEVENGEDEGFEDAWCGM